MKCESLFSGKNKKNIMNLSPGESVQGVVKVEASVKYAADNILKLFFFFTFQRKQGGIFSFLLSSSSFYRNMCLTFHSSRPNIYSRFLLSQLRLSQITVSPLQIPMLVPNVANSMTDGRTCSFTSLP